MHPQLSGGGHAKVWLSNGWQPNIDPFQLQKFKKNVSVLPSWMELVKLYIVLAMVPERLQFS